MKNITELTVSLIPYVISLMWLAQHDTHLCAWPRAIYLVLMHIVLMLCLLWLSRCNAEISATISLATFADPPLLRYYLGSLLSIVLRFCWDFNPVVATLATGAFPPSSFQGLSTPLICCRLYLESVCLNGLPSFLTSHILHVSTS